MGRALRPQLRLRALAPVLVPVSACVYGMYLALLLRSNYASACALLGLFIYLAGAFASLRGQGGSEAGSGRSAAGGEGRAAASHSLFSSLSALTTSRAGAFALTNLAALTSYVYIAFMQHALNRTYCADGRCSGGAAGLALVPPLRQVEALVTSRLGLLLLVNLGFGVLYLFLRFFRAHVFEGRLRAHEVRGAAEHAGGFAAAKVVLLSVLAPDTLGLTTWVSWFALLGFLRLLARLVLLRLGQGGGASFRPEPHRRYRRHVALAHMLLGSALFWCGVAALFCATVGSGARTLWLLAADPVLLALDALACLGVHRALTSADGDRARALHQHTTLAHAVLSGAVAMAQHAHTWLIHGMWGTLLDLFLLTSVYAEATHVGSQLAAHARFRDRARVLEACPPASRAEIGQFDDTCTVCLEPLVDEAGAACVPAGVARRLPCGHIFHSVCLSSWLEQQRSCPTCRTATAPPPPAGRPPPPCAVREAGGADQPDIRTRRPPSAASSAGGSPGSSTGVSRSSSDTSLDSRPEQGAAEVPAVRMRGPAAPCRAECCDALVCARTDLLCTPSSPRRAHAALGSEL